MDREESTSVVLGLGLLWRECWRAVEVESHDEDYPTYLHESLLGSKRAEKVAQAIKEMTHRLPSSDTRISKERPREKKSDGNAKGQKAKAGQEKPATRKRPRTPSPEPSTSKTPSGTQKEVNSPTKNSRSQRQRKPSKKLRGSD